jgi:RloB-like protein
MARKSSDLRRRPASREPKARMVLVCEGKNTEPDYFRALKQHFAKQSVEIKVIPDAGQTMTLAREAKKQKVELSKSIGAKADQVCAIFDCDGRSDFLQAIEFCDRNGVLAGYSNPCFEVWLIWHFQNYGSVCDQKEAQKQFARLFPDYSVQGRKSADFNKIMERVEAACGWSQHHYEARENEGALHGAPSSLMHQVIERIKEFD